MDASLQAPCLCYSSTKWSPNGFDGPVQTCADFVSTAEPSAYPTFAAVEGFCSSVGDVESTSSPFSTSTGGGGNGGIGFTAPPGLKTAPTSTPQVTIGLTSKTTPVATTPVQTPKPAVTTIKSGDAPLNDLSLYLAFRLVFVAVAVMVLL